MIWRAGKISPGEEMFFRLIYSGIIIKVGRKEERMDNL